MRRLTNATCAILPVICSAALVGTPVRAQLTHHVIAVSGTSAPGGGTYLSFANTPTVNSSGQVAYFANLSGLAQGYFLYDGATNVALARTGTATPGGNFSTFSPLISPQQLNASGQFAFGANLSGGSSSNGVFFHNGATVTPIALPGTPAPTPPGGTVGPTTTTSARMNANGDISYVSSLTGSSSPAGLFLHDGTTSTALTLWGTPTPGGGTLSFIGNTSLNDSGQVAYFGNMTGGPGNTGIFLYDGATNVALAVQGTPAPGGGNYAQIPDSPSLTLNSAGQVAFHALGRLLLYDGSTTSLIARDGGISPEGLTYGFLAPQYSLNNNGEMVFLTLVSGSLFGDGIYHYNGVSTSNIALAETNGTGGTAAPGTSGTFSDFSILKINDAGQVAFYGALFQAGGITSANNEGIWYSQGASGLSLLAREGDTFSVNGVNRTLAGNPFPSTLTNSGLAWFARFTDGSEAIMYSAFGELVGSSPQDPLMPDATGPNGEFLFTISDDDLVVDGDDPVAAKGYRYLITGGEFIGVAPPHDPSVLDDDDNSYLLSSVNGNYVLDPTLAFPASEHDFVANGGAVTEFTIRGISVAGAGLDPDNPLAFPSFVRVNLTSPTATITMVPIPEPSSALLMVFATVAFGLIRGVGRRKRAS